MSDYEIDEKKPNGKEPDNIKDIKKDQVKGSSGAKPSAVIKFDLNYLYGKYPKSFTTGESLPLKLGIHEDIIKYESDVPANKVKKMVTSYVQRPRYLKCLKEGTPRVGLDGSEVGKVTAQEAAYAFDKLKELKKAQKQKQKHKKSTEDEKRLNQKLAMLIAKKSSAKS